MPTLTDDNFLDYAMRSYTNTRCHGIAEFHEDLLHIKYIKRLFRKYVNTGEIENQRKRLALNHITIFYNVFRLDAATRMLFLKLEPELHETLKTFLEYLSLMPAIVHDIEGEDIHSSDIELDVTLLESLKSA